MRRHQSSVALSCNLLLTASEGRFCSTVGKLPSNEAPIPHHINSLVRLNGDSFFLVVASISCSKKSSPFSQNLSRPRVGVLGIPCSCMTSRHSKELFLFWNSKCMFMNCANAPVLFGKRLLFFRSPNPHATSLHLSPSQYPLQAIPTFTVFTVPGKALWQDPTGPYSPQNWHSFFLFSR